MAVEVMDVAPPFEVMVEGKPHVAELLLPSHIIQHRVREMGAESAEHYAELGNGVHVLTVLDGAKHFGSDIERAMQTTRPDLVMTGDNIQIESYAGMASSGVVRQLSKLKKPIEGLDVLVVEDILNSGNTLQWLTAYLRGHKPRSVEVVTLLNKDVLGRASDILGEIALHTGFEIPDEFVVGYGLDYIGYYRNHGDISVLRPTQSV